METLLPLYGDSSPDLEEVLAAYQEGWRGDASTAICTTPPRCGACRLTEQCRYFQRSPAITDLPLSQRPRERLMSLGEEHLTNAELLGIIIQSGTERETAVDLAQRLLSRFGDFRSLATKSIAELCKMRGIGPAKATQVIAALAIAKRYHSPTVEQGKLLNDPDTIFEHYHERLRALPQEQFLVLLLNSKLRFIRAEVVATGELNAAHVNPREAFAPALRHGAAAVVFLHNHPSGDPTPSRDDLALTDRLLDSARILGIQVLDHLIIGNTRYTSLARQGYIPSPRRALGADGGAPEELST
ncbi:MAG: DNA repair protein RadC [Candidatus Tectomicrobia bacterium]|nr:DNA repair protein RadC [Candidatus Tectomicrobia bacterium]